MATTPKTVTIEGTKVTLERKQHGRTSYDPACTGSSCYSPYWWIGRSGLDYVYSTRIGYCAGKYATKDSPPSLDELLADNFLAATNHIQRVQRHEIETKIRNAFEFTNFVTVRCKNCDFSENVPKYGSPSTLYVASKHYEAEHASEVTND